MKHLAAVAVLLWGFLTGLGPAPAQALDRNSVNSWMTYYYVTRDTPRAGDFVRWVAGVDFAKNEGIAMPATGFLAALFGENPTLVRGWVKDLKPAGAARDVIERALWLSSHGDLIKDVFGDDVSYAKETAPPLVQFPLTTPGSWDVMWAAFSATGDVAYPARLIDLLDDAMTLSDDPVRNAAFHKTVAWALKSNARQHELILRLLRREAAVRTGPVQQRLQDMVASLDDIIPNFGTCDRKFCADLVPVSEDNLAELEKPADRGPQLHIRAGAKTGDTIAAVVVFTGMTMADDLAVDVSYDIKVTAPDGKIYGGSDAKDLELLARRIPERFSIYDSRPALLMVRFEPQDQRGKYRFDVAVYDKIGKKTVKVTKEITLE